MKLTYDHGMCREPALTSITEGSQKSARHLCHLLLHQMENEENKVSLYLVGVLSVFMSPQFFFFKKQFICMSKGRQVCRVLSTKAFLGTSSFCWKARKSMSISGGL